ncbi:uncharacterized protein LMH87_007675 [Akanthomyces muscarius]|uniref:Cytochrome P450 n=1 Tax=Akanthomyces muscarius TaxID=2231603 RepID=A0A9W8UNP8_AKAMU|nr:uncharacterized protein LMH87_007675 [Akanthomyces muscarius]KAJ4161648.1 hypothetical protein LMH87_007675 [Akanthomyces muscarius]
MIFHERRSSELLPNLDNETPHLAQDSRVLIQCGTLTTSWTLSLAIFHLCHRPETLRKLRNELIMAIPNAEDVVSLTQLQSLPYLGAVVKEALRHSVGTSSSISRIAADEPFEVVDRDTGKSYQIPAGTVISMSPYRTIMDESIFDDPLSFDPERWLQNYEKLDKYLIIFGGGDDCICIGQKLVQAELYLMLAKLFRRWGSASRVRSDDAVDTRKGNVVVFEIAGTTLRNCSIPLPYEQSKGLYFHLQAF